MRKDVLHALISSYDENRYFFCYENERISFLKAFLESAEIKHRRMDEDVSFVEFAQYLRQRDECPEILFSRTYFESQAKSTLLFHLFKSENPKIKLVDINNPLTKLPGDLRHSFFAHHLSAGDLAALAQTSHAFYHDTSRPDIWKIKLLQLGCAAALLDSVIATKTVTNYKKLYKAFYLVTYCSKKRKIDTLLEMLCLSGELAAIQYAFAHQLLSVAALQDIVINGDIACLEYCYKQLNFGTEWSLSFVLETLCAAALGGNIDAIRFIIARALRNPHLFITQYYAGRVTPLHFAAAGGSVAAINELVSQGFNYRAEDANHYTVMHHAAITGHLNIIRSSIKLAATNRSIATVYHEAAKYGQVKAMETVIQLRLPREPLQSAYSAIHLAAYYGQVQAMRKAAELDDNVLGEVLDESRNNLLHVAAQGGHPEAMHEAVRLGVNPLRRNEYGMNALHIAAQSAHIPAMEAAIALGINPQQLSEQNRNVFHHAVMSGNINVVQYALETYDIDVNSTDFHDKNAIMIAIEQGHTSLIIPLRYLGVDMAAVDDKDKDVFMYAALMKDPGPRMNALAGLTAPLHIDTPLRL